MEYIEGRIFRDPTLPSLRAQVAPRSMTKMIE